MDVQICFRHIERLKISQEGSDHTKGIAGLDWISDVDWTWQMQSQNPSQTGSSRLQGGQVWLFKRLDQELQWLAKTKS